MRLTSWASTFTCLAAMASAGCQPSPPVVAGTGEASSTTEEPGTESGMTTASAGTTDADEESTAAVDEDTTAGPDPTGAAPLDDPCLQVLPLVDMPGDATVAAVSDGDGDGRQELWLLAVLWNPVSETQATQLSVFEATETVVPELVTQRELPGEVVAMADIDGDGWPDALMQQWDQPLAWWHPGLPSLDVDTDESPLSMPGDGTWLDADGDGRADLFEVTGDSLVLHRGDGMGGLSEADSLVWDAGMDPPQIWPAAGDPGRLVVRWENTSPSAGPDPHELWAIEVDPTGQIDVVLTSPRLRIDVRWVEDFDNDGVPEVLAVDAVTDVMIYAHGEGDEFSFDTTELFIDDLVVGDFDGDGATDLMHWIPGDASLRLRMDEQWPSSQPLAVDGSFPWMSTNRAFEANGGGPRELLVREPDSPLDRYHLGRFIECE